MPRGIQESPFASAFVLRPQRHGCSCREREIAKVLKVILIGFLLFNILRCFRLISSLNTCLLVASFYSHPVPQLGVLPARQRGAFVSRRWPGGTFWPCCFPPQESSPALLSLWFPTLPPKASTSPGQPPTGTSTSLPLKLLILTGCWSPWSSTSRATQGLLISQGFLPALISLSTSPGSLAGSAHRQSVLQLPQVHKAYLSANSAFLNSSLQVVPLSLPSAAPPAHPFPNPLPQRLPTRTSRGRCELWMLSHHPIRQSQAITSCWDLIHTMSSNIKAGAASEADEKQSKFVKN